MDLDRKLAEVCEAFCIKGTYVGHEVISVGNVNKTYRVEMSNEGVRKSFLLQNVNTFVFKNPVQVMDNIDKVTEHIRGKASGGGPWPWRAVALEPPNCQSAVRSEMDMIS